VLDALLEQAGDLRVEGPARVDAAGQRRGADAVHRQPQLAEGAGEVGQHREDADRAGEVVGLAHTSSAAMLIQ
jgi:hypothetical protein